MQFNYQPSAAGISWLVMSQTLDSRTQMQAELLAMSATNSAVQVNLTSATADQTKAELMDAAQGQYSAGTMSIAGACVGIVASLGTTVGFYKTMGEGEPTVTNNKVGITEETTPVNTKIAPVNPENDISTVTAQNTSAPSETTTPSNSSTPNKPVTDDKSAPKNVTAGRATLNHFFSQQGNSFSQALNSGVKSVGDMQQSAATEKQAEDKRLEAIAQGLQTVMNAQGQMLTSAESSSDTFFNNLEGSFTTIIQVSAVRG